MKKLYFLSIIIVPALQFCSNQNPMHQGFQGGTHEHHYHGPVTQSFHQAPTYQPPTFHNNNHNNSQGGYNEANAQQSTNIQHLISQKLHNWYQDIPNKASSYCNNFFENKYNVMLGTCACGYLYIYYQLHKVHTLLKNQHSWCNWKQAIATQHLVSIPYQEIMPELISDIQKTYVLKMHITDNKQASTLANEQFIHDAQQELAALQHYLSLQKFIKTWWLSLFFGRFYDKNIIKEKISRLQIILDIFITWQTNELLYKNEKSN